MKWVFLVASGLLLGFAACARTEIVRPGGESGGTLSSLPAAPSPRAAAFLSDCQPKCEASRQMQAVAFEKIRADCRAKCISDCVNECVRRNQMKAVGPQVIEGDCRRECGAR
jgi:hypothetical protein